MTWMDAILLSLLLVGLGVAFLGARRLRRIHARLASLEGSLQAMARSSADSVFRQLEALQALYAGLRIEQGLPPTRDFAASPDLLLALATHTLSVKPHHIVECGSGVSTLVLARCAQLNGAGHVYSLEHLPEYAAATRSHLAHHALSEWATVVDAPLAPHHVGNAAWSWYSLDRLPGLPIDLLVVDGPPGAVGPCARYPAGPLLFGRLSSGAAVFLDDASREDEKRAVERWMEEDPALTSELLPLEKGCAVLRRRAT